MQFVGEKSPVLKSRGERLIVIEDCVPQREARAHNTQKQPAAGRVRDGGTVAVVAQETSGQNVFISAIKHTVQLTSRLTVLHLLWMLGRGKGRE